MIEYYLLVLFLKDKLPSKSGQFDKLLNINGFVYDVLVAGFSCKACSKVRDKTTLSACNDLSLTSYVVFNARFNPACQSAVCMSLVQVRRAEIGCLNSSDVWKHFTNRYLTYLWKHFNKLYFKMSAYMYNSVFLYGINYGIFRYINIQIKCLQDVYIVHRQFIQFCSIIYMATFKHGWKVFNFLCERQSTTLIWIARSALRLE